MYSIIANAAWIVILIVWSIGFIGNKKTQKIPNTVEQTAVNLLLIIGFVFLFIRFSGDLVWPLMPFWIGLIGIAIAFASAAFAVWARVSLGKNWSGAVITVKENHELVQHGPYALVRHPIYTGFFFTAVGTAVASGSFVSFLGALLILVGFLIRIRREEALMHLQFPNTYPAYVLRTKMLVPFIL